MSLFGSAFSAAGRALSSPVGLAGVTFAGLASFAFVPVGLFVGAVACLACLCDDNNNYYRPSYGRQRVYVDDPYASSWWSMGSWFDRPWFNSSPSPAYTRRSSYPRTPSTGRSWPSSEPSAPYSAPTGQGSWFGGSQRVTSGPVFGGASQHVSSGPSMPGMGQRVG